MTLPVMTTALFVASLQSFYVSNMGGPVIPYIGGLIILTFTMILGILRPVTMIVPVTAIYVAGVFAAIALVTTLYTGSYKSAAGIVFGCAVFLATVTLLRGSIGIIIRALRYVIIIHLFLLLFQICWYFIFNNYLDYLYFTDDNAVWNSLKGWTIAGELIPRFTGAYNEPGSYSGVMGALVGTYYYLSKKAGVLVWIVVCSLIASAALTGAILAAGIIAAIAWDYAKKLSGVARPAAIIAMALLAAGIGAFIFARFAARLQFTGGSEDAAIQNLSWLLDLDNMTMFGHSASALPSYVSVEYFGVWMTTYIQFGMSGLLALMTLFVPALFANPAIFGTLLLAKVKITFPLIYILAAGIWVVGERAVVRKKNELREKNGYPHWVGTPMVPRFDPKK